MRFLIVLAFCSLCYAEFSFLILADTRSYRTGFITATSLANNWAPKLAICPGDMDPVHVLDSIFQKNLGPGFPWFNSVGNHEQEEKRDLDSCASFGLRWVSKSGFSDFIYGPALCPNTTYSFVYTDSQGIRVQMICVDGYTRGDTVYYTAQHTAELHTWLASVLENTVADYAVVYAHPPVFAKYRHTRESWETSPLAGDFWRIMQNHRVSLYACGHTHSNYWMAVDSHAIWKSQDSAWNPDRGVIQMDAGALRYNNNDADESVIIKVNVKTDRLVYNVYTTGPDSLTLKSTFTQLKKRTGPSRSPAAPAAPASLSVSAFPNPFRSSATIKIASLSRDRVREIKVYNARGQMVRDIAGETRLLPHISQFSVVMNARGLECGATYLVKVKTDKQTVVRELIFCK